MERLTPEQRYATLPTEPERPLHERMPRAAARRIGNLLYSSGRTARDASGELIAVGQLGAELEIEDGWRCAWQCASNVVTAVRGEVGSLDAIASVVRVTVFIASAPGFFEQSVVADGATQYFHAIFGPQAGHHARSAIGVMRLPGDSPVEVEAIFELRD
ncbi:RidA family protein [Micromonospora sp. CPCC 205371]|nr:RidA family protein [Micromonospora sp. CPCC 205371]